MTQRVIRDRTPLCLILMFLVVGLSAEGTGVGGSMTKKFDSRCTMPNNRTEDENQWPLVLGVKSPLLEPQGKNFTGRSGDKTWKYSKFMFDDKCGATVYIMVESAYVTEEWPKGFTPKFSWGCTLRKTTGTTFPTVDVIFNSTVADMSTYPGLKEEWYTEGEGSDRRILVILKFPHFDTSNSVILDWICQAKVDATIPGTTVGIGDVNLILYPIGCPKGKYGGECEFNCTCPQNATCHTFNGACKCPDGWEGEFCDSRQASGGSKTAAVVLSVLLAVTVVGGLAWCWKRKSDRGKYQQMFQDL
ncbi:uncharacterized protein [Branchiostoma lanceolatum]|uniref:uncharacterized protein n=1 Tax=Branchiostoma lanceolatum TaxID=7740 RepID=UPI003456B88D